MLRIYDTIDFTKISGAAEAVLSSLIITNNRRATKFLGPNLTVKLTRQRKESRSARQETFLLTVGRPNHAERKFIKDCKKAGEPVPVNKVQLRAFPKKRVKKTA